MKFTTIEYKDLENELGECLTLSAELKIEIDRLAFMRTQIDKQLIAALRRLYPRAESIFRSFRHDTLLIAEEAPYEN